MSDYNYNFEEKPKNNYSMEPERGGCLTAFLAFVVIVNFLAMFLMFGILSNLSAYPSSQAGMLQMLGYLQIGVSIAVFVCVYGLWNWKTWGYYGLIVLYAINAVVSLLSGQISTIAGAVIGIGVLFYVMKDKTDYLE